jgi:hypothetical protein
MSTTDANQHSRSHGERPSSVQSEAHLASTKELALISLSARLLFENVQSTEKVVPAVDQLADALGVHATVLPRWGDLTVCIGDGGGSRHEIFAAAPVGVDMRRVAMGYAANVDPGVRL